MNKYIKSIAFFALGVASIVFTGCEDFLDEKPQSQYSADTFYQGQSDFRFAIAAVYAQQQNIYNSLGGIFRTAIVRSDDAMRDPHLGYCGNADKFIDDATSSEIAGAWSGIYTAIYRANAIIEKIDGVEFTDPKMKDYIKGEALALRAWGYYTLGTLYGGVPLIDRNITAAETRTVKRSTQAETFAFAADDYLKAIDLLPEEWDDANKGRITKYAAKAGLARLYMFQSNFTAAAPQLKDIINSGKYKRAQNYVDCFSEEFNNGSERVWEIQFKSGGIGEGNILSNSFYPENYADGGKVLIGASARVMVSSDLVNAYEEGDLRKNVTIVNNLRVGASYLEEYYCKKWINYAVEPVDHNDYGVNLPVVRYTDVLLMYAECLNEAGFVADGEAFNIVNDIRSRAGLAPLGTSVNSQDAFRTALKKERRVEFAFEGLRWFDLVRWGDAMTVMNAFLKQAENQNGQYSINSTDRYIYAIPQQEMDNYNDIEVMWQNPGYN